MIPMSVMFTTPLPPPSMLSQFHIIKYISMSIPCLCTFSIMTPFLKLFSTAISTLPHPILLSLLILTLSRSREDLTRTLTEVHFYPFIINQHILHFEICHLACFASLKFDECVL